MIQLIVDFLTIPLTDPKPPEDADDPVIQPQPIPRRLTPAGLAQGQRPFTGSRNPIVNKLYKHSPRRRRRY